MNYELIVYDDENGINSTDDNVDVEVRLDNGKFYTATFFTLENVRSLLTRYKSTGECANGLYLWTVDMIIVENLSKETIRKTVDDLIESGEISSAFSEITT